MRTFFLMGAVALVAAGCSDGSSSDGSAGASAAGNGGVSSGSGGSSGSTGGSPATGGSSGSGTGGSSGSGAGGAGTGGSSGSGAGGASTGGSSGAGGGTGGSGAGGAGTGGSAGSSGGAGGSGGSCPGGLDDEFDDPCTAAAWAEENFGPSAASWDINGSRPGHLTIAFSSGTPNMSGWFEDFAGPGVFKRTSGDFIAITHVTAGRAGDRTLPATGSFNSAGLIVRNPASTSPGNQNWLMHNVGNQAGTSNGGCPNAGTNVGVGSEAKTTVNSNSTLCLNPTTAHAGRIAICRHGDSFHMLRRLDDESSWTETNSFVHSGMSNEVDIGPIANGWGAPFDLVAEFDYLRISSVSGAQDCTAAAFDTAFP